MTNHFDIEMDTLVSKKRWENFEYGSHFAYIDFFRYILPVLKNTRPGRLLDIGSGSGAISICLAKIGFRVDGIDDSPVAIANSNMASRAMLLEERVRFEQTDLIGFYPEHRYGVVLCLDRIEHTVDDEEYLTRVRDLMVEDGLLILSTPLQTGPLTKLGMSKRFDQSVGHRRRYSRNRIVGTLMRCGFNVDSWIETEGIVRNALLVNRRSRSLARYLRGALLTRILTAIDDAAGRLFGFSKIIVISRKK